MNTVAIIGASNNRTKFGNKAVRAFLRQGYTVFPVNPKETKIEGLPTFRSVREVPVRPESSTPFAVAGLRAFRSNRINGCRQVRARLKKADAPSCSFSAPRSGFSCRFETNLVLHHSPHERSAPPCSLPAHLLPHPGNG